MTHCITPPHCFYSSVTWGSLTLSDVFFLLVCYPGLESVYFPQGDVTRSSRKSYFFSSKLTHVSQTAMRCPSSAPQVIRLIIIWCVRMGCSFETQKRRSQACRGAHPTPDHVPFSFQVKWSQWVLFHQNIQEPLVPRLKFNAVGPFLNCGNPLLSTKNGSDVFFS